MKWWYIPLAILFLIILLSGESDGIAVYVSTPEIADISESIPANGKVRPVSEVHITPDVSGEIVEILFEEGMTVQKGDLLIKIKPDIYVSILDQAMASLKATKAQYAQQEASLERARVQFERYSALLEKKAISLAEYEEAKIDYTIALKGLESSKYQIQSAQAGVREAQENLSKTSIYSPMDGVITKLLIEKGERVVGTSQMAGTEIMRISDMTRMEVVVDVNENDIARISKGDSVEIVFDALRHEVFGGIVTKIANSSKNTGYNTGQVASFEVNILIEGESEHLRPGMSASVTINTEKKENIITVPLRCINPNGCIFVVSNDRTTVQQRSIITGIQDIHRIEIIEGIGPDEEIVIGPHEAINKSLTDNGKIFIDRD
jgi:HlyD family secretion protein